MAAFLHSNGFKAVIASSMVFRTSLMTITMRLAQQVQTGNFHPASVVFMCEVTKLCIWCMTILTMNEFSPNILKEMSDPQRNICQRILCVLKQIKVLVFSKGTIVFFIPATLFVISTIFNVLALKFIDPAHFILLMQLRLLLTAALSKCFLNRIFTLIQWAALISLTIGVIIAQAGTKSASSSDSSSETASLWMGTFLALITAACSALAGVVTELLLKGTTLSLPERSIQFCAPSTISSLLLLAFDMLYNGRMYPLLENFTVWTWLILAFEIMGGFLMAMMLRFGSSVLRSITSSFNLFLTTILSLLIWPEYRPSLLFIVGGILVTVSALVYFVQTQAMNALKQGRIPTKFYQNEFERQERTDTNRNSTIGPLSPQLDVPYATETSHRDHSRLVYV